MADESRDRVPDCTVDRSVMHVASHLTLTKSQTAGPDTFDPIIGVPLIDRMCLMEGNCYASRVHAFPEAVETRVAKGHPALWRRGRRREEGGGDERRIEEEG